MVMKMKKNQKNVDRRFILAMACHIAWLWAFPLFGPLQQHLFLTDADLLQWNLFFLIGSAMGYFSYLLSASRMLDRVKTSFLILPAVLLMAASLLMNGFDDRYLFFLERSIPLFLGIASALYIVRWSAGLAGISRSCTGRHMGAMMLCAAILYAAVFLFHIQEPVVYLALAYLALSGLIYRDPAPEFLEGGDSQWKPPDSSARMAGISLRDRLRQFWIPFLMILFVFYLFSNILLMTIFPLIRDTAPVFSVAGILLYGAVAWFAGLYVDKEGHIEKVALLGLISLGIIYLLTPAASQRGFLALINLGLEVGYAMIDLFIWCSIAFAARVFQQRAHRYYGFGLGMNILFILAGILVSTYLHLEPGVPDFARLALLAGVLMLVGVFPALAMKNVGVTAVPPAKETPENDFLLPPPEELTQREKEVFQALMTDLDNAAIQEALSISKNTLKTHIRHVYAKAGVKSRVELVVKYKGDAGADN